MAGRFTPAEGRYGGKDAAQRRVERRARFLEAGLDLFGAGPGYRGTRLADLCKEAGLSSRQFYEEFETLEDLLATLHLAVNDAASRAVFEVLPQVRDLPLPERTTRLLHAYVKGATTDRRYARIAYVEVIGVSPRMDLQRLERRSAWIDFLTAATDDAVARGEIQPGNYRVAAAAFVGAINGLMHDWVVGWVDATLEEIADELRQMLLGRLKVAG
ncbi:TetR/AcrR family transcriptional regulator [Actinocorallia sp. API 0066]|uniref:TetR/AcrR family transcriptional regulator n=1 Tax=Actinocorallia sp. API 0066 TaxID=2896846 RepID=UPI001E601695|nr:TetR/AcrR family transcriptional regulator [Actinocorallia sp. API 0066]MCD0453052.1 TetR/AcrR family transcriptional regulator [Actinocorallia sp. API 0066]